MVARCTVKCLCAEVTADRTDLQEAFSSKIFRKLVHVTRVKRTIIPVFSLIPNSGGYFKF